MQTFYTELLAKGAKAFQGESVDCMEKNLIDQFIIGTKEENIRLHLIERTLLRSVKKTLDCAVAYKNALMYKKNISENNGEIKEINKKVAAIY